MAVLTLDYRCCDRKLPLYIKHIEVERIAATARQQARLLAGEQGRIPREPRIAELHRQLLALRGVRVNAESIGFELLVHVEYDNAHSIIMQQVGHAKSR